jgi:hypothetical protein
VISAGDLVKLRIDAETALDGLCDVIHRSFVDNDSGGQTTSEDRDTDIPCKVLPAGKPAERIIAAGVEGRQLSTILLPFSQAIITNDYIEIGAAQYEVAGIDARTTQVLQQVVCVKVK